MLTTPIPKPRPRHKTQVTLVEGESKDVLTAITLRVFDQEKAVAFYNNLGKRVSCGPLCVVSK